MEREEYTIEELNLLNLKNDLQERDKELFRTQKALEELQKKQKRYYIPARTEKNSLKFAAVGDTHIGSLYSRIDAFNAFLKMCKEEGINTVLHVGDVLDGNNMYRGQEYELECVGADAQVEKAIKSIKSDGLDVHFITGNHDEAFFKQIGFRVGPVLAKGLGWNYLGAEQADIVMTTGEGKKFKILMVHPGGGTAYAVSYKMQKLIESIPGGQKPNMVLCGHFHKADDMPQYRNVVGIQIGCFQSQTPFMKRKPTQAHLGGYIIEVVFTGKRSRVMRIKTEFVSFYETQL